MSDPFEPGDEYALMHCPECGFEWEQLLMYEPD